MTLWHVKATLLGSGTSTGVPIIGCDCRVCRSEDPHDTRLRCSLYLRFDPDEPSLPATHVLIDTSPDLRAQALASGMHTLDGVLFTHEHADHVHGIDDLRPFLFRRSDPIPAFADARTADMIVQKFPYTKYSNPKYKGTRPKLDLHAVTPGHPFQVGQIPFLPLQLIHAEEQTIGYRVGDFAYLTDVSKFPPETSKLLRGVKTMILDACRERPHTAHFNFDQAIKIVGELSVDKTYLIHFTHDHSHLEIKRLLEGRGTTSVEPGYDQLQITFDVQSDWIKHVDGLHRDEK